MYLNILVKDIRLAGDEEDKSPDVNNQGLDSVRPLKVLLIELL